MIESTSTFWESMYSRNIGKLIGICYRYTRDRQLAEDLAHDAFLKAIDKSKSFEGRGHFDAWLRKVVVNHVLQHLRDQKRIQHMVSLSAEPDLPPHQYEQHTTVSTVDDFSESELLELVNDLPEHHRLVFNLYVIDGFTHAHIGELLGISKGTSKSHLARARKKLRELLLVKARSNGDRKRSFLWLIIFPALCIDKIYGKAFSNFAVVTKGVLAKEASGSNHSPAFSTQTLTWNMFMAAATTIGIILTSLVIFYLRDTNKTIAPNKLRNIVVEMGDREILSSETTNDTSEVDRSKSISQIFHSKPATNSAKRIIPYKNINSKSMKTLDSVGVMLLISSSVVFDSVAQSVDNNNHQVNSNENHAIPVSGHDNVDSANHFSYQDAKMQHGTFTASSLYWSGEDNEVYFKGRMRVDTNEQQFTANGTASFLGAVHMLIVDGKPVAKNSTVRLKDRQHSMKMLTKAKAIEKYGDDGKFGAVEIALAE